MKPKSDPVSDYIERAPENVREVLLRIRSLILELAPGAQEGMAYGMPAYRTHGRPLIYFAAFKRHLGLYATPSGHAAFAEKLAGYKQGKGSVQFPWDQPIPYDLIREIIQFRVSENEHLYG